MTKAAQLERLLGERILILDGAMGTMIQSYKLAEADYRGERFAAFAQDLKGNNDLLSLTRPRIRVPWKVTTGQLPNIELVLRATSDMTVARMMGGTMSLR